MTITDYLIDISLIAIVLVQVRGRRLTLKALLLPLGIVAYVAANFLKGVPTAHNDLVLIIGATVTGAILGLLAGKFTKVTRSPDGIFAKAGLAAAALWILGTGGRLTFQLYATHGGGPAIVRFSAAHGITSAEAWTSALILMALAEVVMRTGVLAWRSGLLAEGVVKLRVPSVQPAHVPNAPLTLPPVRSRSSFGTGVASMMDDSDRPLS